MRKLVIGTRESKLAVTQAKWVKDHLEKENKALEIELKYVSTKGDQVLNVALSKVEGTGIFSTDIEQLLIDKEIDLAVHSLKDLPVHLDERFALAAIPEREDARDALISRHHLKLADLPKGAVIGTSSPRRQAQIKALRPDLKTDWIRGPIDSRIKQLEEGKYDAIILAVAGLNRLNLSENTITEYLPIDSFVPAFGQGALAIQCRKDDGELYDILRTINDEKAEQAVIAERALMQLLDDEDKAPIGVYAQVTENGDMTIYSSVSSLDGEQTLFDKTSGQDSSQLVKELAQKLEARGARDIINRAKEAL